MTASIYKKRIISLRVKVGSSAYIILTVDIIILTVITYILSQAITRDFYVNPYDHNLQQNLGCNITKMSPDFLLF
jgi:hypothetical protein